MKCKHLEGRNRRSGILSPHCYTEDLKLLELRAGKMVKSTVYSSRGHGFNSEHLHGGLLLSVTPVLGDLTWQTHTQAHNKEGRKEGRKERRKAKRKGGRKVSRQTMSLSSGFSLSLYWVCLIRYSKTYSLILKVAVGMDMYFHNCSQPVSTQFLTRAQKS